jgi:hypothetical protein
LADRIRDDYTRLNELWIDFSNVSQFNLAQLRDQQSSAERDEYNNLCFRLNRGLRAVACLKNYNPPERQQDIARLNQLRSKCGELTEAENAEEAQLLVRLLAYRFSSEGRLRNANLISTKATGVLTPAEQSELDAYHALELPTMVSFPEQTIAFLKACEKASRPRS